MSVTAYFYIGPYITVTTETIKSFKVEKKCMNTECTRNFKKNLDSEYCPQCGTKTTEVKIPCNIKKDWCPDELALYEHFEMPHAGGSNMDENVLIDSSFGYEFSNRDMGSIIPMFTEGQTFDQEDTPNIKLEKFKKKHAKIIKRLEDYGAKLKFYYGVVCHGS